MRRRLRLAPIRAFDVGIALAVVVIAIAAFVASSPPHAVLGQARDLAARMAWRSGYETGLLLGLAAAATGVVVVMTAVVLVRRRSRAGDGVE